MMVEYIRPADFSVHILDADNIKIYPSLSDTDCYCVDLPLRTFFVNLKVDALHINGYWLIADYNNHLLYIPDKDVNGLYFPGDTLFTLLSRVHAKYSAKRFD